MTVFHFSLDHDSSILRCDTAATIGFFDGVHRGHQYLVEQLMEQSAARGLAPVAVTFDRHPREVLQAGWHPRLLSTLEEKEALLAATGIERMVVLHFDELMARLSAREFMRTVLSDRLGVRLLLTGYDNRFGHRQAGVKEGFSDYVEYGRQTGIEVACGKPLSIDGLPVSSSRVRALLEEGGVGEAARCLGRRYSIKGTVEHGEQMGRRMGFPTANIRPSTAERLVPARGVYAVEVLLEGNETAMRGMTNIGTRPTFDGHRTTIETNIFGFQGDIYGREMEIRFVERVRDERHFASAEELRQQMTLDRDNILKQRF